MPAYIAAPRIQRGRQARSKQKKNQNLKYFDIWVTNQIHFSPTYPPFATFCRMVTVEPLLSLFGLILKSQEKRSEKHTKDIECIKYWSFSSFLHRKMLCGKIIILLFFAIKETYKYFYLECDFVCNALLIADWKSLALLAC